jgi:gamma-glutamyltranspeptidase/glutathione hydrolase
MGKRVVVCPEPLAAAAGAAIFRAGGSAIDAAIGTAFAQAVVSPAMTSIAGSGVMNVYHAPSKRNAIVDFLDVAGSNARADMFADRAPGEILTGYASMLVPTFVRGTALALERFGSGRVSWQALLEPAIRYAEEGFTVYPYMHQYWRADAPVLQADAPFDGYAMLSTTPACAAIFTTRGRVHGIGERIVQPDLARTLRRLAAAGPDDFYVGETGRAMAADFAANASPVTARDLADYRAEIREPARGSYRGLAITTDPRPGIGPVLLDVMSELERHDVRALGQESAAYYDLLAHTLFAAFARRAQPPGTTHVTAYDAEGSAVSMTHTVCFGSGVVTPGLGFIHNNGMCMFDPRPGEPNSIAPGKRPLAGGGPAIVFDGDVVRFAIGSPHGGRKTSAMVHVLASMLDFGLSPPAAVASPRIHCERDARKLRIDPFFPPAIRSELERRGYILQEDGYGGRVCMVAVDPATGTATGATDPRGGGGLTEISDISLTT